MFLLTLTLNSNTAFRDPQTERDKKRKIHRQGERQRTMEKKEERDNTERRQTERERERRERKRERCTLKCQNRTHSSPDRSLAPSLSSNHSSAFR